MVIRTNRWHRRLVAISTRPVLTRHEIRTERWQGADLTIAILSDFHAAEPHAGTRVLGAIAHAVTGLKPDLILLGGDFIAEDKRFWRRLAAHELVTALGPLAAPLGIFAVLGNHDWADCPLARSSGWKRNSVAEALEASPVRLLMNTSVRLAHGGQDFWLAGMDSQGPDHRRTRSHHDPEAAFRDVPEGGLALLLAHEPDYFATGDPRALVQISGHTHGGQLNLLGWRPFTPSRFKSRYAHGLISEGGRYLVVSGGLGFTALPMRVGAPPEVTVLTLGGRR